MTTYGNYDTVSLVRSGSAGKVYDAVDRRSNRRVVLNVLHAEYASADPAALVAKLQTLTQLNHRAVVPMVGAENIGGTVVVAFEPMDGTSLATRLQQGPLAIVEALATAAEVAEALGQAHALQPPIVHQDLRPENILLTPQGPKLVDFGVAPMVQSASVARTTAFGNIRYMSPEQIDAIGVDARSDLYVLGVVLYEMLTGTMPWDATAPRELLDAHVTKPPREFGEALRAQIPQGLESLVLQLLAKRPGDRPASAYEVAQRLRGLQMGPAGAAAPTAFIPATQVPAVTAAMAPASAPKAGNAGAVIGIIVAVVLLVGAAAAGVMWFGREDAPQTAAVQQGVSGDDGGDAAPTKVAPATPPSPAGDPAASTTQPAEVPADPETTGTTPPPEPGEEDTTGPSSAAGTTAGSEFENLLAQIPKPAEGGAALSEQQALEEALIGPHRCGIHWIGKPYGICQITRDGDKLKIKGGQKRSGDFLRVNGTVRVVSAKRFVVTGTVATRVSSCCGNKTLSGSFTFRKSGRRKFYRLGPPMRERFCDPFKTCMYYIDIFDKPKAG